MSRADLGSAMPITIWSMMPTGTPIKSFSIFCAARAISGLGMSHPDTAEMVASSPTSTEAEEDRPRADRQIAPD